MILKTIFNLFLFLFLAIFQIAFIGSLPSVFREMNILLIFMVLFLETGKFSGGFWWFLLVGFIFGLYNSFFFAAFLFVWPLVFLFCRFLYTSFFTNRSLYSFLGLTIFATWFYSFLFRLLILTMNFFSGEGQRIFLLETDFWLSLFWSTVMNFIAALLLFYLMNQVSDRLKPVFIVRKK